MFDHLEERPRRALLCDLGAAVPRGAILAAHSLASIIAKKIFDASDFQIALILAGPFIGNMLSLFLAGVSEHRRKLPFVVWPEGIGRASLLLVALVPLSRDGASAFTAIVLFANMMNALAVTATTAVYESCFPRDMRSKLVGHGRLIALTLAAFVPLFAGRWLDVRPGDFRWIWVLSAFLGVGGTWIFSKIKEPEPKANPGNSTAVFSPRRFYAIFKNNPSFSWLMFFWFLLGSANFLTNPARIKLLNEPQYGFNASITSNAIADSTILNLMMVLSLPVWARLLDKVNLVSARVWINLLQLPMYLAYAFCSSMTLIYIGTIFCGIGRGGGTIFWTVGILNFCSRKEDIPYFLAIHTALTGLRGLICPIIAAKAMEVLHPRSIYIIASVLVLISSLGFALLVKRPDIVEEEQSSALPGGTL